jgi:hypothetical protein
MVRASIPSPAEQQLRQLLAGYHGLEHLHVIPRGTSLTLYSGSSDDPISHARFTWLGGTAWALSLPRHTGRWEKTPFTGTLDELVQLLTQLLGFHLAVRDEL